MRLLAHRGVWSGIREQNGLVALKGALAAGYGVEFDVRDLNGELVISHDPPVGEVLRLETFLSSYHRQNFTELLAINVKASGLQKEIKRLIQKYDIGNYFLFDCALPDAIVTLGHGLRFYTRQSEYEREPSLYDRSDGVWLDCFNSEWFDETLVARHLHNGKHVAFVSPELHGREPFQLWEELRSWRLLSNPYVSLCTDRPRTFSRLLKTSF